MEISILDKLYEEFKVDIFNDEKYWELNQRVYIVIQKITSELSADNKDLTAELDRAIADVMKYGDNKNFNKGISVARKLNNDINAVE